MRTEISHLVDPIKASLFVCVRFSRNAYSVMICTDCQFVLIQILHLIFIEYYQKKISKLTFFVNPLDLHQFFVVSGADDLDERLLVCSQTLETQRPSEPPQSRYITSHKSQPDLRYTPGSLSNDVMTSPEV